MAFFASKGFESNNETELSEWKDQNMDNLSIFDAVTSAFKTCANLLI